MKKFTSLLIALLLLLNTIYIPVLAAPVAEDDVITYSVPSFLIYENNFNKGGIGDQVEDFSYIAFKGSTTDAQVSTTENYVSATYEYGVGGNDSNVLKISDRAYYEPTTKRYDDDGNIDSDAINNKVRNHDTVVTNDILTGARHVVTKFRYYAPGAAVNKNGAHVGGLTVMHAKSAGNVSSTTPQLTINATGASLNFRHDSNLAVPETAKITGLETKKWYDVVFETKYDSENARATSKVTIDGKTAESYISMTTRPTYAPNGYDDPAKLSFSFSWVTGGRFYIDDLSVTTYSVPSNDFEDAVNEFSFKDVVSGNTSNLQNAVYESWPKGLITSYPRGANVFNVEWKSSNPNVITPEGEVTRRSYPQNVTLTAKITDSVDPNIYAERKFQVVVAPLEGASDAQILSEYAENVIKESAYSSEVTEFSNRIKNDILPLPTRDETADIDILWTADPPGYIDVTTGKVTRPSYSAQDTEVTLTALLSKNGVTHTKTIKYTVVKNVDPNGVINDAMDNMVISSEPLDKVTKNLTLPTEYNGAEISWDTTAHSRIAENGTVTRGDAEVTADIIASITFDNVTRTKTYTVTVYPTVMKMIEKDIALIDRTGWDALVTDFEVPYIGSKYGTVFSWTSDDDYVQVGDGGKVIVKRPPNSHPTDREVTLLLNAKIGRDEVNVPITITILRQKDDQTTVNETASSINFDLIKGANENPESVTMNLPLPTGFDYDKGIKVEWSSNNACVKSNGEVVRPLPGDPNENVTLTAVVKKNYATSAPVTVSFTVQALSSEDELLQDAKNALSFSVLSSEEIGNVTKNLYLPDTGKYGSTITWKSNSNAVKVSGTEGIVTLPQWGEESSNILLEATITYNGVSTKKSFSLTIPESDTYVESEVFLNENFNSWTNTSKFGSATPTGIWALPDSSSSGSKADLANYIGGANNPVVSISHSDGITMPLSYTSTNYIQSTSLIVGMKFYVGDDFEGTSKIDVLTKGSDIAFATAYINGSDSTIDIVTANETVNPFKLKLAKGTFNKNTWNELRFDINTRVYKYVVYLNGVCITQNGYVTNKETGDPFVSVNGIPLANKDANLKGIASLKWVVENGTMYIDDLYIKSQTVHTEDLKNAADLWEEAFLSSININKIEEDFKLPSIKYPGVSISVASSNGTVLNIYKYVNVSLYTPVTEPTPVTLTATFDNTKTVYKRSYTCIVYPPLTVDTSMKDSEAVTKDLKTVVDYINENYLITNLKDDLNLSNIKVVNGSTITYKSSDTSVMSDSGEVKLGDTLNKVNFTITATKGAESKSQTLEITVGKKSPSNNAPSGPSSPGKGNKPPVSGENTRPQTGIDVGTPDDGNGENEGQGTSKFTDVAKDHWAYDQIDFLVEKKILNGVGDGRIEPERTINREEFVKMLVMALELDIMDATEAFTDVDKNEWYAPYVATIKEKGLINGFEDGSFGIGQNISRQDLAVLIYRSSRLAAEDVKEAFADDSEIADYAKDAVYTLRDLGIINGKGEGKFDPSASATRAETATMLYKAIKAGLFEL